MSLPEGMYLKAGTPERRNAGILKAGTPEYLNPGRRNSYTLNTGIFKPKMPEYLNSK